MLIIAGVVQKLIPPKTKLVTLLGLYDPVFYAIDAKVLNF